MCRDNVPTIHLETWPVNATLFEGDIAGGPVPTLFSSDVEAASDAISKEVAKAHWDVNKLAKVFIAAESVTLKEALGIIKKPR